MSYPVRVPWKLVVVIVALTIVAAACDNAGSTTTTASTTEATAPSTPPEAKLVVTEGSVKVNEIEVSTRGTQRIEVDDEIELMEGARALLTIGDQFYFELFKGTKIQLVSVEIAEAKVNLDGGHLYFKFEDEADARLEVETPSSVLTTLASDTEFTACQPDSGNTCVVVQRGAVELESAGKSERYEEGEGTFKQAAFIVMGEPPEPAICVPDNAFEEWFEGARLNDDPRALGALVSESPPCGAEVRTTWTTVLGTEQWTDTGINVQPGDTLKIEAGGAIRHASRGELRGPDGDPDAGLRQFNLLELQDINHSALIGRIDDVGAPFLVGRTYEATVETEGRLFLGINDRGLNNNAGEFLAIITVVSGADSPAGP